jgi:hypothetical protein
VNFWFPAVAVLVVGTFSYAGWRVYEAQYPTWSEQVQLSDGRVIVVRQKHEYYENYGTARSWVTIDLPELGGKREWASYLMPQRVDVYAGKVYVFGLPRGPKQLEYYRYPRHYMAAFVWSGNEFVRIPFLSVPEALRQRENVLRCVPRKRRSLVTLDEKQLRPCPPRGREGELTSELNLDVYTKAADRLAAKDHWESRSD